MLQTIPLLRACGFFLFLMTAFLLAACEDAPSSSTSTPPFHATDITGIAYAQDLQLPDTEGKIRSIREFGGKIVVVFFGFTHCPDVCPTTLSELRDIKKQLGTDGNRLQVIFATLDPDRDTAPLLKSYVSAFDPSFIALRGTESETAAAAKNFHIFYQKNVGKTAGSYSLDHTAAAFIYDTRGRIRLYHKYGSPSGQLLQDLQQLLKE